MQMAEVSLTFNNTKNILPTEYSTVTIARRYYRSGESEYELNGVPCRLKDITNLFLDTGIASNSYAIIELKMVDPVEPCLRKLPAFPSLKNAKKKPCANWKAPMPTWTG